jgi:hypothetical protein
MLRTDGMFRVLGSPLVGALGSAGFAKSCMTGSTAAFVESTRPLPTSSAFHGVCPSSLAPPSKPVIMMADFTSGAVRLDRRARGGRACEVRSGRWSAAKVLVSRRHDRQRCSGIDDTPGPVMWDSWALVGRLGGTRG